MNFESGSFRDPSGQVFIRDNGIYRSIFPQGSDDYEAARDNLVLKELIDKKLLIPQREVGNELAPKNAVYCLKHPKLSFLSYPWEWPFSMLKDAALLHLKIMKLLIPRGFWLRDASAFNVQWFGNDVILIDTLSIGKKIPNSPWIAYKQFCSHFLAPLALAAYCDIRMFGLWRNYIDGYPLDLTVKMLRTIKKFRPGILMHLTLHSYFQKMADTKKKLEKENSKQNPKMSDQALMRLVNSLNKCILKINWKINSKIWSSYNEIRNYEDEDVNQKKDFVSQKIKKLQPQMVWDLGGNIGEFSLIAANNGAFVVSIDGDPACTEFLYRKLDSQTEKNRIIPLTMDLANPTPELGWASKERMSLTKRGPADLVLALALIHHLVFSANVPLGLIADWFAELSKYLIVEYIPPTDPMVKKLIQHRAEHLPYSLEVFKAGFGGYFEFTDSKQLNNGRILFFCKRKQ